jgi:hypothetical protein
MLVSYHSAAWHHIPEDLNLTEVDLVKIHTDHPQKFCLCMELNIRTE